MHKSLLILILCLFEGIALFAGHKFGGYETFDYRPVEVQIVRKNIPLAKDASVAQITKIAQDRFDELEREQINLVLAYDIASPGGRHLSYDIYFSEIRVYQSQLKVNMNRHNEIESIALSSLDMSSWSAYSLQEQLQLGDCPHFYEYLAASFEQRPAYRTESVVATHEEQPEIAVLVTIHDEISHRMEEVLVTATEIAFTQDLNCYFLPDSIIQGKVFMPDPLTSSGSQYQFPYLDNDDADGTEINAERVNVPIRVDFTAGTFSLVNEIVEITNFDPPNFAPASGSSTEFYFTRSEPEFEDVNAFYHITQMQEYLQSIGFTNLASNRIQVDPHSLNGDDNSFFQPSNPPRLLFGEGGVDDAEDADVVVHEYGHAISFSAAPNTNAGNQRQSMDEGIGDYIAASYSRAIDTFRWADVFTWDGHNQYWSGRTANTNKYYPDDLNNSIHSNGEMWSSAWMEIWEVLGKTTSDQLFFQTLYANTANLRMNQAAANSLEADTMLFGGRYSCFMIPVFVKRGLLHDSYLDICRDPSITANAGNDSTVCRRSRAIIGTTESVPGFSYQWQPEAGVANANAAITSVRVDSSSSFVLTVIDTNGFYNLDTISFSTFGCPENVLFYNTDGFQRNGEPITIFFPFGNDGSTISIVDLNGRVVQKHENVTADRFELWARHLPSSGYVIRVDYEDERISKKVVRVE